MIELSLDMKSYLFQRFIRNNRKAYHRYYKEWMDNVTQDQLNYFILEKERLNQ